MQKNRWCVTKSCCSCFPRLFKSFIIEDILITQQVRKADKVSNRRNKVIITLKTEIVINMPQIVAEKLTTKKPVYLLPSPNKKKTQK